MSYNVLILHAIDNFDQERSTSVRHVLSIETHTSGNRFVYHHIGHEVSDALRSIAFDIIVIDVTFLCWRWIRPREAFSNICKKYRWVADQNAFRIALPQDEYDHSRYLDQWLSEMGVDCVYSCFPDKADVLYPSLTAKGVPIVQSYTGLIDATEVERYRRLRRDFADRPWDIGYRVRRLPANFGRFGILKSELGRRFAEHAEGKLKVDISDDPKDTLLGDSWPRFLGECRFVLGCESGASVIDYTGEVKDRVDAYMQAHPEADFEEVHAHCITPSDERHTLSAFSPRTFEIAMAGACPVLVEGTYNGLLEPDVHYIPVAKDLSNIPEVIGRLEDWETAQAIARRAGEALLGNPELRYEGWVEGILRRADETLSSRPRHQPTSPADFERLARSHYRTVSAALMQEKQQAVSTLSRDYQNEIDRLNSIYPTEISHLNEMVAAYEKEIARLNEFFSSSIRTLEARNFELEVNLEELNAHPLLRASRLANRTIGRISPWRRRAG